MCVHMCTSIYIVYFGVVYLHHSLKYGSFIVSPKIVI
jgi:hypothetical protein